MLASIGTITARNLVRLVRVPTLIAFATVQPILFVLLFTYGFGGAVRVPGVAHYIDYLLPGLFVLAIGFGASQTGVAVAEDLANGMIDRFRSLPITGAAVLAGRVAADAVRTVQSKSPSGPTMYPSSESCLPPLPRSFASGSTRYERSACTCWDDGCTRPHSVGELTEYLMGPQPHGSLRDPELARASAEAAGLRVRELRTAELRTVFHDIGAVVYFLRLVIWIVPDFDIDQYRDRLADLDRDIRRQGSFVAHARRFLIEAAKLS